MKFTDHGEVYEGGCGLQRSGGRLPAAGLHPRAARRAPLQLRLQDHVRPLQPRETHDAPGRRTEDPLQVGEMERRKLICNLFPVESLCFIYISPDINIYDSKLDAL